MQARTVIDEMAAALDVRPSKFAHVTAITHFARALGAARSSQLEAAKADVAKLAELRDRLRAANDAYWAEQVDIQWQAAAAWLALTEGWADDVLTRMRAAADAEDRTEKSPVTPGPLAPARELLGAMLLATGKPQEALARVRGNAGQGAQPARRHPRRRQGRRPGRRGRRGGAALRCRGGAHRERRSGAPRDRRGRAFVAKQD